MIFRTQRPRTVQVQASRLREILRRLWVRLDDRPERVAAAIEREDESLAAIAAFLGHEQKRWRAT